MGSHDRTARGGGGGGGGGNGGDGGDGGGGNGGDGGDVWLKAANGISLAAGYSGPERWPWPVQPLHCDWNAATYPRTDPATLAMGTRAIQTLLIVQFVSDFPG